MTLYEFIENLNIKTRQDWDVYIVQVALTFYPQDKTKELVWWKQGVRYNTCGLCIHVFLEILGHDDQQSWHLTFWHMSCYMHHNLNKRK